MIKLVMVWFWCIIAYPNLFSCFYLAIAFNGKNTWIRDFIGSCF
jgi:hypothetical protein